MPLEFTITPQGRRALDTGVLPSQGLDEGLLVFIEVNGPVTLTEVNEAFTTRSLRNDLAPQLLTMRRMNLITQEEV